MPIYTYKCETCEKQQDLMTKYEDKTADCKCGGNMTRQPSYRFNAHGLPNGFSTTRSGTRGTQ